jgi:CelD/BcsL family acetyltransferase involved in cellulose biosynthesis
MKIVILDKQQAHDLVQDPCFIADWKRLYSESSWATVYQGPDFVRVWYDTYRIEFTPVLVIGRNEAGELAGLFTLVLEHASGRLIAAGASHAEYHAWLARPGDGDDFIESALEALCKQFPGNRLTLLFAPPGIPLGWTRRWSNHCHVKPMSRALLTIGDGVAVKDSLRKRQNKINRLKRFGNLRLDRITFPEELEQIFDEIIHYQAFRLRAIHHLHDQAPDPFKKRFYSRLMSIPGMVHATALRLDGQLISAQVHLHNGDQIVLTLITHSPIYAKHSPGMLHTYMVAAGFAGEGVSTFDLTPGGAYKDRYASHHDEAYTLTIFFNSMHCRQHKLQRKLAEELKNLPEHMRLHNLCLKQCLVTAGDHARKWALLKKELGAIGAFGGLLRRLWKSYEACVYAFDLKRVGELPVRHTLRRDCIPDLLLYQPRSASHLPMNRFFKHAWDRFENGNHSYTSAEDGQLDFQGWMIETPVPGDEWEFTLPESAVVLADFQATPRAHDQGTCRAGILQMLQDAAQRPGVETAYAIVPIGWYGDPRLSQTIEELGFTPLHRVRRQAVLNEMWQTGLNVLSPKPSLASPNVANV